MGMVDGIVMELKGFWFLGLAKVFAEYIKNLRQNRKLEKRLRGELTKQAGNCQSIG